MDAIATSARATGWRRAGVIAAWCAIVLLTLLAGLALYLSTDHGQRRLADALERLVSDQIPGTMKIGQLERFGLFEPVVHELEFIDSKGARVLRLQRAEVDIDVGHMLRGRLGMHRAAVSGGEIVFEPQPDGRTSLAAALDSATPGSGNPEDGFHYDMRSIHVQGLAVRVRVAGADAVTLRNTRGFVSITRETTPGVQIRLERIRGDFDQKLLGADVELLQADGEVRGKNKRLVDMQLKLRISDSKMAGRMTVHERKRLPVELELDTDGGVETSLAAMGLKLGSWFSDAVDVKWK
jgi:hypothetical protein